MQFLGEETQPNPLVLCSFCQKLFVLPFLLDWIIVPAMVIITVLVLWQTYILMCILVYSSTFFVKKITEEYMFLLDCTC